MNKIILKTYSTGFVMGVFLYFYYEGIAINMGQLFDLSLGYIGIKDNAVIILDYTKWFFPQLLILVLWGDYYYQNIILQYEYVATRVEKCWKLIAMNYKHLLGAVIVFCSGLYMAIFIMGYVNEYKIEINERILINIIIYCMHLILVVIYVNCISMRIKVEYAIMSLVLIQYSGIVVSKIFIENDMGYEKFVLTYQMLFYYKTNYSVSEIWTIVLMIVIDAIITSLIGLNILKKRRCC